MSDSGLDQGPFIVSAGPWRIILLAPLLVLAGVVFLFLALVMVYVDVANLPGRLAFWGAALGFAAMAIYFLLLAASLALRVEVAPDALRLRIPRWQGVLPWFPWIRAAIPYADIAAVETRDDVYSSFGLTSVQTVYSVATKAGRRIVLGFTSPLATWNYPFDEAAARIARNAGVAVTDRGAVEVGGIIRSIIKGTPPWSAERIGADGRATARRRAALAMQIAFAMVVVAVALRACLPHGP
ncbi:MAG TPA: hypothetical protein VGN85_04965 [Methyloceanibacter sp.]|jgi:hypothetical protein|nr:hypothetical protein [Methyloceanibacter sp.]